jgi:hypothetical protein
MVSEVSVHHGRKGRPVHHMVARKQRKVIQEGARARYTT